MPSTTSIPTTILEGLVSLTDGTTEAIHATMDSYTAEGLTTRQSVAVILSDAGLKNAAIAAAWPTFGFGETKEGNAGNQKTAGLEKLGRHVVKAGGGTRTPSIGGIVDAVKRDLLKFQTKRTALQNRVDVAEGDATKSDDDIVTEAEARIEAAMTALQAERKAMKADSSSYVAEYRTKATEAKAKAQADLVPALAEVQAEEQKYIDEAEAQGFGAVVTMIRETLAAEGGEA